MSEKAQSDASIDEYYASYHARRIQSAIDLLRSHGAKRVIELGGHPWAMTREMLSHGLEVAATVSAEEVLLWPDELEPQVTETSLSKKDGGDIRFPNYSANLERTLFDIDEQADAVVACEIIEHCSRSPHVMLLNINRWLQSDGLLLITTPNGVQFNNPFRRKPLMPALRADFYERHRYLFSMSELVDLLELCGFRIIEARFENPYPRTGLPAIYDLLARLPLPWFRQMFGFNLSVVARKSRDVDWLDRIPFCYHPSEQWEWIRSEKQQSPG